MSQCLGHPSNRNHTIILLHKCFYLSTLSWFIKQLGYQATCCLTPSLPLKKGTQVQQSSSWVFCIALWAFLMFGSIFCWEGEFVCFAIFRLLCNYAREGISKHHGLDSEKKVVFLWWAAAAHGETQQCQIFPSKTIASLVQINYTPTARNPIVAETWGWRWSQSFR